jgi:hypothetical protein
MKNQIIVKCKFKILISHSTKSELFWQRLLTVVYILEMLLACCQPPGNIIIKIFQYQNSINDPFFLPNVSRICQIFRFHYLD